MHVTRTISAEVSNCNECPYFSEENDGHFTIACCEHPAYQAPSNLLSGMLSDARGNGIDARCPLLPKLPVLFRLKSNPDTIVRQISPTLIQVCWAESWEHGDRKTWIYGLPHDKDERFDNLIMLSEREVKEILDKRLAHGIISPL